MRLFDRTYGLTALAVVGGLIGFSSVNSASAQSGCADSVINGTSVRQCYTSGNNYVTFSNSCGTQHLTQQQLGAGAIPNQIIPCPRTSVPSADLDEPRRRRDAFDREDRKNRESLAREHLSKAVQNYKKGVEHEKNKHYSAAEDAYGSAESYYGMAGDIKKEAKAHKSKKRVQCNDSLRSYDLVSGQGHFSKEQLLTNLKVTRSHCRDFPNALAYLDRKAAEVGRAQEEEQARTKAAAETKTAADKLERQNDDIKKGKVSCSTITDKDHPSSGSCTNATRKLDAAKAARTTSPRQAVAEYRDAAEAFRLAGDAIQAAAALAVAVELETAASSPPPGQSPATPKKSDPLQVEKDYGIAKLVMCNTTFPENASVALMFESLTEFTPWTITGWRVIQPGKCEAFHIQLGNQEMRQVGYHLARPEWSADTKSWNGCVPRQSNANFVKFVQFSHSCSAHEQLVGFQSMTVRYSTTTVNF